MATRDLRGLREAWGSRARWARRAWECLDPRDLPGSRAQRGLPDQGATGGVEACAATKAIGVPRASEGLVGTEPPASLDHRDHRARRGLWESRACPDGDILGSGGPLDLPAGRACRAFLECVEAEGLPALTASGACEVIREDKADRARLGLLGPWECQGRRERRVCLVCLGQSPSWRLRQRKCTTTGMCAICMTPTTARPLLLLLYHYYHYYYYYCYYHYYYYYC